MLIFNDKKTEKHIYHQSIRLELHRSSSLGYRWSYLVLPEKLRLATCVRGGQHVISVDGWESLKPISVFDLVKWNCQRHW